MQLNKLAKFSKYILIGMFLLSNVHAQKVSKTGTTAANFLQIPVGAAATGLGGAFVSLANDASALYWNVSGIANMEKFEAQLVHTEWIAETSFDYAGAILPLGEFGTLGLSFTSLKMDDMKVTTIELPDGTGEYFSASDIAFGVSYARMLTDRFSIGFTVKYIQQSIWHMNASAFAVDAGTKFRTDLLGGMTIGATITNFGTSLKLSGRDTRYFIRVDDTKQGSNDRIPTEIEMDEWDLPLVFQIGVSTDVLQLENYKLVLAVDAIHPNNDYQSMNAGAEFAFNDYLFIRGGYQSLLLADSEGGLSFGMGVNSKMLFSDTIVKFDYAYRDFGRLENTHTFSLSIKY
ncbi:MAG: PorV/PorQ family protein [Bacteroidetes bacterium]|nr:PorV/PorQ family protein [Bacteroidota bacterium]